MVAAMSLAEQVRNALQTAGFGRKVATVRSGRLGWSSNAIVTVKDASAYWAIYGIAMAFQAIRVCQYTGDTLSGANRYVDVVMPQGIAPPDRPGSDGRRSYVVDEGHPALQ